MANKKGNRTTHTKLNEQLLKTISLNSEGQDQQTTSLNVDIGFTTGIPRLSEYEVTEKKSSEDEGKMENIAQHSLQTSIETKVRQINPLTWQREYKNSNTIPYGTL